jgi:hypothetical protein
VWDGSAPVRASEPKRHRGIGAGCKDIAAYLPKGADNSMSRLASVTLAFVVGPEMLVSLLGFAMEVRRTRLAEVKPVWRACRTWRRAAATTWRRPRMPSSRSRRRSRGASAWSRRASRSVRRSISSGCEGGRVRDPLRGGAGARVLLSQG